MNRKSKLFFSLVSLCFSIAVLCFGVYSALSVSYSISGNVSYEINDVFVELDLSVYRALSTTPVNSATHNQNVSTIKDALGDTIPSGESGFSQLTQYQDHESSYEDGMVQPGNEYGVYKTESPKLDLTYGSPTNDNQGYAFYIVIDIHNLGSEIINAQITAPTSLENTILRDSGNVEISSNGTEDDTKRIVLGLAIDDVTLGIDQVDFSYIITISRGELPEIEPISDMTFTFNENNKTATLTSYTGTDTMVEIPETIGSIKQTTKMLGPYADISELTASFTSTPTAILDAFLVGDIYYTSSSGEQMTDKNQMIYLWMQDSNNVTCTNIAIECKSSYTLRLTESDIEDSTATYMLFGPAVGYIFLAVSSGDLTILDSMTISYTIRLNNRTFYIDKNAVIQGLESNSGSFMKYADYVNDLLSSATEITVTFEDILYGYTAIMSTDYTVTSIGDEGWILYASSSGEVLPIFPSTVESISLPNTLTYIQYHAFEGTQWLENLRAQEGYTGIITANDGKTNYYLETPQGSELTTENVNSILQDVQVIGDFAFGNITGEPVELSGEIFIPNTVTGIGAGAFTYSQISGVTFENNSQLTSIGYGVFANCNSLETVTFGENSKIESIGLGAFGDCSLLNTIEIPSSVTSIGSGAFDSCEALETVTFEDNSQLTSIGSSAFSYCSNLTSIKIPSGVTSIEDDTFEYCRSLTTIEIPSSVVNVGEDAFYECDALETVIFGDNSQLTSIGEDAFYGCDYIQKIYITDIDAWAMLDFPDGYHGTISSNPLHSGAGLYLNEKLVTEVILTTATKIGDSAFNNYSNLTSVTISNSVTSIGSSAFYDCDELKIVTFKDNSQLTNINSSAFYGCDSLKTVTFGDNSQLTSIEDYAFRSCSNLNSMEIPSSVTSIGSSAFYECNSLETVTFEENSQLTSIEDYAFHSCSNLNSMEIPSSVTSIGYSAFYECNSLETVTFGYNSQLTYIRDHTFSNCSSLTSIEIPNSVTSISNDVFNGCSALEIVTFEENSQLTNISWEAFYNCSNLTSIEIPSSVTSIGDDAFYGCGNIQKVYITDIDAWAMINFYSSNSNPLGFGADLYLNGDLVTEVTLTTATEIEDYAFYYHSNLTSITIPSSVTSIGSSAFSGCCALAEVYNYSTSFTVSKNSSNGNIGYYAKTIYNPSDLTGLKPETTIQTIGNVQYYINGDDFIALAPSVEKDSITQIQLDSRTTEINQNAFADCSNLTSVEIPSSVTSIGSSAFSECDSLETVTFGDNSQLTSIGFSAFYSCTNLTSIEIPSSVTSIDSSAFYSCTNLTSIEIPSSVTSIGSSAFRSCSNLITITIPNSVRSIGDYAFSECTKLENITVDPINATYSSVDGVLFNKNKTQLIQYPIGNTRLQYTIPSSVTMIKNDAFYNCSTLETVIFEDNSQLESIGSSAFYNCNSLKEVYITNIDAWAMTDFSSSYANPIYYGADLYLNDDLITEVTLTVATKIEDYAFYDYSNLTSITISSSVTSIGNNAFDNCSSLRTVIFEENSQLTSIGEDAFSGCSNLTSITIPSGVTIIGEWAFYSCSSLTSIEIPNSVTSIGKYAFYCCSILTRIEIPSSVTSIGDSAFRDCYALAEVYNYSTSFTVSKNSSNGYLGYYAKTIYNASDLTGNKPETTIQTIENVQYYINGEDFIALAPSVLRDNLTTLSLDSRTTEISNYAFSSCSNLTSVEIPSSVTSIGDNAFQNCYALVEVYNHSTYISEVTLGNTSRYTNGYLGQYAKVVYNPSDLTGEKPETRIQTIGNVQYYIYGEDFIALAPSVSRYSLTTLSLDSRTTEIGDHAFSSCSNLNSVEVPSSVTSIGDSAFNGCIALKIVTFGESSQLDSIAGYVFSGCSSLASIEIPSSVTSIGSNAFNNTPWLTNLRSESNGIATASDGKTKFVIDLLETITDEQLDLSNVKAIAGYACSNCDALTNITIPNSVINIGEYAFVWCSALETVIFEENSQLENIGERAFEGCDALTSITIPKSVISIGEYAFNNLDALETVTFEENSQLTSIGSAAFWNCTLLTNIALPSSVMSIGSSVFSDCSSLTSITIPSSVTSIGSSAFSGCSSLTSITIPSSVTSIGSSAFYNCSALETITFEDTGSVWVLSDSSSTEIKANEHTADELVHYLKNRYRSYTWTKKQSA